MFSVSPSSNTQEQYQKEIADDLATQKRRIELIKNYALSFLGHGYDKLTNQLLENVFEKFSIDLVNLTTSKTQDEYVIAETSEEATQELKKRYGGKFNVDCPLVDINGKLGYNNSHSTQDKINKIVFAATHIDSYVCALKETPQIRHDLRNSDRKGDAFVQQAWVYTGYKIFFDIDTNKYSTEDQADSESETVAKAANLSLREFTSQLGGTLNANKLSKEFESREITGIRMLAEGFGDYRIDITSPPKDVKEIHQVIEEIKKDYIRKVDTLMIRAFFVDDTCLCKYDKYDIPTSLRNPATLPAKKEDPSDKQLDISILPPGILGEEEVTLEKNFWYLASQIMQYSDKRLQDQLKGLNLVGMFSSIEAVFSGMFKKGLKKEAGIQDYTMVIGITEAGKSTVVGYLQGAEIGLKEIEIEGVTKIVAEYKTQGDYPKIGHFNSETKGTIAYGKLIDTGGFFDSAGPEEDICNSIAIHIAAKTYQPSRLIVVLSSTAFENRSSKFLKLIEKLQDIVYVSKNSNVLGSVVFLVNDFVEDEKTKKRNLTYIENKLKLAIKILEKERNKQVGDPTLIQRILAQPREMQQNLLGQMNPSYQKFQQKIDILENVQKLKNIIVADIFDRSTSIFTPSAIPAEHHAESAISGHSRNLPVKRASDCPNDGQNLRIDSSNSPREKSPGEIAITPSTRDEIESYFKSRRCSQSLVFITNNSEFQKLKSCLLLTVNYFNSLYTERSKLTSYLDKNKNQISKTQEEINTARKTMNKKKKTDAAQETMNEKLDIPALVRSKKEDFKILEENITTLNSELHEVKGEIEKKKKEIDSWQKDKSHALLATIGNIVQPRSFWSWFFPKTYSFKHEGKIPISNVVPYPKSGTFEQVSNDSEKEQGNYEANYTPRWYEYGDDREAKIEIYVKNCDHPSTLITIENIQKELSGGIASLKDREKNLTRDLDTLKDRKSRTKRDIQELKDRGKLIETAEQTIKERSDSLDNLKEEKKLIEKTLSEISATFQIYHDFCQLIGKIITVLEFNKSSVATEQSIFSKFLENVKTT